MRRSHSLLRSRVGRIALLVCVLSGLGAGIVIFQSSGNAKAAGEGVPLLLVTGFAPTKCLSGTGSPDNSYDRMEAFLQDPSHAWNGPMYTVGLYKDSWAPPFFNDQNCDVNLGQNSVRTGLSIDPSNACDGYYGRMSDSSQGTDNESLRHVACRFAWFIYNSFTVKNIPVAIVAHSLGGIMVRYALGESGLGNSPFPPSLLVESVVTLGAPYRGLDACGHYYLQQVYWYLFFQGTATGTPSAQLNDLVNDPADPGPDCLLSYSDRGSQPTQFLQDLSNLGVPRTPYLGTPTYWSLVAASGAQGSLSVGVPTDEPQPGQPGQSGNFYKSNWDGVSEWDSSLGVSAQTVTLYTILTQPDPNVRAPVWSMNAPLSDVLYSVSPSAPYYLSDTSTAQSAAVYRCTSATPTCDAGHLAGAATTGFYNVVQLVWTELLKGYVTPPPPTPTPPPAGYNFIVNGTFAGGSTAGWIGSGSQPGASFVENRWGDHSGDGWYRAHWLNTPYNVTTSQPMINMPSGYYQAKAWFMAGCASSTATFTLADTSTGNSVSSTVPCTLSTWTQITLPPVQITSGRGTLSVTTNSPTNASQNDWIRFDDVEVKATAAPPPPTPTPTTPPPPPNPYGLVVNGGFENGNTGWQVWAGASGANGGASYNESKWGGHNGSLWYRAHWKGSAYDVSTYQDITLPTTGDYLVSAWVETSCSDNTNFAIKNNNTNTYWSVQAVARCLGGWTNVQLPTFHANAGTSVRIEFYSNNAANEWLRIDDVSLVKVSPTCQPGQPCPQ